MPVFARERVSESANPCECFILLEHFAQVSDYFFNFCFFKILSPILKLLSSMCLIMELPGINRLSLLSTWQDLLEYLEWSRSVCKLRLRLICHVPQALSTWLVSIDLPVKRRGKKNSFQWSGRESRAIISDENHRVLEVGSAFHFLTFTTLASKEPSKVSTCQMGDSL